MSPPNPKECGVAPNDDKLSGHRIWQCVGDIVCSEGGRWYLLVLGLVLSVEEGCIEIIIDTVLQNLYVTEFGEPSPKVL